MTREGTKANAKVRTSVLNVNSNYGTMVIVQWHVGCKWECIIRSLYMCLGG
jgi:hypothetical protein